MKTLTKKELLKYIRLAEKEIEEWVKFYDQVQNKLRKLEEGK